MEEMEELILLFCYQTFNSPKLILLYKTLKAAKLIMADRVILNCTNTELFAANIQKNNKLNILPFNTIVKELMY